MPTTRSFSNCSGNCWRMRRNKCSLKSEACGWKVKKLQEEIAQAVDQFLSGLKLAPIGPDELLDSGAEEQLFRDLGRRAVLARLRERWQAADPEPERYCPQCGSPRTELGVRGRTVRTISGVMELCRRVTYCPRCQVTDAALDRRLGLEQGGVTPALARVLTRTSLEVAYDPGKALLTDVLGFTPCSAREMERIAKHHGQRVEAAAFSVPSIGCPHPVKRAAHYCIAIDGVMIPGLPNPQTHRLDWHEVKAAVVFTPSGLRSTAYLAALDQVERFGLRLWNFLQSRGLDQQDFLQVLGDGAPWIWNLADLHLPGVPQLLDFYHVAEHLHATAKSLWTEERAGSWVHERLDQLQTGRLGSFFASLRRLPPDASAGEAEASPQRLLEYFLKNRRRLDYRSALRKNLPIGSGVVESAGRHIVQLRLKQSGMRWSPNGAQAILNLRTLHRSGDFEQYWEDHVQASA